MVAVAAATAVVSHCVCHRHLAGLKCLPHRGKGRGGGGGGGG